MRRCLRHWHPLALGTIKQSSSSPPPSTSDRLLSSHGWWRGIKATKRRTLLVIANLLGRTSNNCESLASHPTQGMWARRCRIIICLYPHQQQKQPRRERFARVTISMGDTRNLSKIIITIRGRTGEGGGVTAGWLMLLILHTYGSCQFELNGLIGAIR